MVARKSKLLFSMALDVMALIVLVVILLDVARIHDDAKAGAAAWEHMTTIAKRNQIDWLRSSSASSDLIQASQAECREHFSKYLAAKIEAEPSLLENKARGLTPISDATCN